MAEVEYRGALYRFTCRYEIFRPFQAERNGIYNIDGDSGEDGGDNGWDDGGSGDDLVEVTRVVVM